MKKIICILLCCTGLCAGAFSQSGGECLSAKVVVLADWSESVQGCESFISEVASLVAERFEFPGSSVSVGLLRFGSIVMVDVPIMDPLISVRTYAGIISKGRADGKRTDMMSGVRSTEVQLGIASYESGERHLFVSDDGKQQIVIVVSDGFPDDASAVLEEMSLLKEAGVIVVSILVPSPGIAYVYSPDLDNRKFLKDLSSPGMYLEEDVSNLVALLENLGLCF